MAQIYINGQTDEVLNRSRQYPMELIKGDVMKTIEVILPGSPEYGNTDRQPAVGEGAYDMSRPGF